MNIIQAMNRLRSDIQTWVANNLKTKVNTELKTDSTEEYKVLSDNNFTDADKDKVSNLAKVATSGSYNDLINKPTIPPAQVNSDWNATSGVSQILNKPTIPDTNTVSNWGFTKTNGTVTKVSTGDGLTGGDITATGTIKCNLVNFTRNTSAALASDSDNDNRLYPVSLDKDGKLSVKVPWVKVSLNGDNEELNEALSNYVTKTDIDDYIPTLSGGKAATTGKYVSGVTVSGHTVTVTQADLPGEQYKGTVTSITPGTGLTGGSTDTAITTSGTINLKTAATGEIGGIKVGSVSTTSSGANKTINANKFAVHVDKDGLGYVAIPEYSNNSGDITGVTAGNGLTGGATSGNATLNVGAGAGISVGDDAVAVNIKDTTKNSKAAVKGGNSDKLYAVELDSNGKLAVSVPWTATTFEGNDELEALLEPFALKTDLDAYKTKQTAKSSPTTTNSTSTEFIDTISQDANGVITATKKKLPTYTNVTDTTVSGWGYMKKTAADSAYAAKSTVTELGNKTITIADKPISLGGSLSRADLADALLLGGAAYCDAGDGLSINADAYGSHLNVNPGDGIKIDENNNVSLKVASSTELGGIKTDYVQTDRNYPVAVDTDGSAYVNVPWVEVTSETLKLNTYKKVQDVVTSAKTTTGNATSFIDTLSQNEQGIISYTKKSIDLSNYRTKQDFEVSDEDRANWNGKVSQDELIIIRDSIPTHVSDLAGINTYATQAWVNEKIAEVNAGGEIELGISDVKVNGTTVVADGVANIDLSGYATKIKINNADVSAINGVIDIGTVAPKTLATHLELGLMKPMFYHTSGTVTLPPIRTTIGNISVQNRSSVSDRYYGVELDAATGAAYVNVPWTDTETRIIPMLDISENANYPLLFSNTADMISGDKYGIGYDSSILTYNPSTNTLRIGNSSTANTSHGLIKFGGKNDDCYIGTDALNATLSLSGSDSITFYEGSSGYECVYKSGALYPLDEGTLGTSTYSWDDVYTKSAHVPGSGSIYFNGTSNHISGSSTTQLKLTGGSGINFTIGSTNEATISSSAFYPTTNAGLTLGTSTYHWGNTYLGNTYIGKTASGIITLGVNNTITGNYNSSSTSTSNYISIKTPGGVRCATGFYETSDERLKDFKGSINIDFDKLKQIPKEYFIWKSDVNNQTQIGTSAQKLKEVYPELVTENEDGSLTVSYNKLSVVALKAVDILDDRCKVLEDKNKELEERLSKLEALINNLK